MDLIKDWSKIQEVFESSIKSSKHAAIATVDANGCPTITPIGFTFLNDNQTAYYFEQFSEAMPINFENNKNVCLLLVNSRTSFWAKSLITGKFSSYPGIRLYGTAGERRQATPEELTKLQERKGILSILKGSKLIWADLTTVRDIQITSVRPIKYPRMMEHLLGGA